MVSPLVLGEKEAKYFGARRGNRGADQPRSPNRGFLGTWSPFGYVNDVKASDEERTWINRVTSEIVFSAFTSGRWRSGASGACDDSTTRTELHMHYPRDITDGMKSFCNFLFS